MTDTEMQILHKLSTNNRNIINHNCGCFSCLEKNINIRNITEWTDGDKTALCPFCGVDAIIPIKGCDRNVLELMHNRFFAQDSIEF